MTAEKPLVTVGIPVFNAAKFIERALDSIVGQDYSNVDILISDNGSSDETEVICQRYVSQDSRVRYVRQKENRGGAWNHRYVVGEAKGKYFRYQAHDDECKPTLLTRCVEILEAEPDAVLCYPKTEMIDDDGRVFATYEDGLDLESDNAHERLRKLLNGLFYCNANYGVIRLDVLRKTRLLGAYMRADHVQLAELALRGKFREVPETLFMRRFHSGMSTLVSDSNRGKAAWFDPRLASAPTFFPIVRLCREHLRAIYLSDLPLPERLRCYAVYNGYSLRWLLSNVAKRLRGKPSLEVPLDRINFVEGAGESDRSRLILW